MQARSQPPGELFLLFQELIRRTFLQQVGISDPALMDYLAAMLTDFAHFDTVYGIRASAGAPLREVADMLEEADVRTRAASFERERQVHKHIGDFTLFWTGVYPEYILHLRRQMSRDALLDYVSQGKSSYYIASTFDYGDYAEEARILRCLSHTFETVAFGLQGVRSAWEDEALRRRLS